MKYIVRILILLTLPLYAYSQEFSEKEINAWKERASRVTIIRDNWGVPHIYAETDADVVFGLMYAQCEDDFRRVEYNYIRGLGRLSEIEGESQLFNDLWAKAFYSEDELKGRLAAMPEDLRELMEAFADGMNYYLATHPEEEPTLIERYESWYPLVYSEGSSEGNVSNQTDVSRREIAEFFATQIPEPASEPEGESKGSNGMALAPSRTANGNAMLLINPHVSVYHRLEAHLSSEEGLDVYGAISKGQFFVYHGFNNYCGWMHTSSGTDSQDAFLVSIREENGEKVYSYGDQWREVTTREIPVKYLEEDGTIAERIFSVDYTHHGPVVAKRGDDFVTITPLHQPDKEIEQYTRSMKANGLDQFTQYMRIRANSTNNTVYADVDGNIAYWNGNFVPVRNPDANYRKPVASNPENDWKGLHPLEEIIHVINPVNGWIQNCNSTPYLAAGDYSPKPADYPAYMTGHHHNPRAANAIRLLDQAANFTPDDFRNLAYDNYLQLFDLVLPPLFEAWDAIGNNDGYSDLAGPVSMLRSWDRRATITSGEVLLGEAYARQFARMSSSYIPEDTVMSMNQVSYPNVVIGTEKMTDEEILEALRKAYSGITDSYGRYDMPLGEVLRFQRINDDPTIYDPAKPSLPSRFVSGFLGSLPAAYYRSLEGTDQQFYAGGNSFIAVVDFGDQVEAWTIVGGGQSADPDSPHYTDQAEMFMNGELKKVYFTKEDVEANVEREYHPGE